MSLRRTFITGLVIVLPVIVTFWLLSLIFGAINSTVTPVLTNIIQWVAPGQWLQYAWVHYISPVVGITLAVLFVYAVGLVGGNVLGRQVLHWVEGWVLRVPVVRGIYSAVRQFLSTFSRTDGQSYRGVALVEFPRSGCWALGLITGTAPDEVAERVGRKLLSVFVPTSPNPTGGYVLFVPEEQTMRLDMTVDAALRLVLSGGVLSPATLSGDETPAL